MKRILVTYAQYNLWANRRMLECLLKLSSDELNKPYVSSFPGILSTVVHLRNAESIWWQRIRLSESVEVPGDAENADFRKLAESWVSQSGKFADWVLNASPAALDHVFEYRSSKKESHKQPVWEVLLHLFNHQSYHRGQLVTMLRQSGLTQIPNMDFISFSRNRKSVVVNDRIGNPI